MSWEYDFEGEDWLEEHQALNEEDLDDDFDFNDRCETCPHFRKTVHNSGISWLGYCLLEHDIFNPKHVLNTDLKCEVIKVLEKNQKEHDGRYQCLYCKDLFDEIYLIKPNNILLCQACSDKKEKRGKKDEKEN